MPRNLRLKRRKRIRIEISSCKISLYARFFFAFCNTMDIRFEFPQPLRSLFHAEIAIIVSRVFLIRV